MCVGVRVCMCVCVCILCHTVESHFCTFMPRYVCTYVLGGPGYCFFTFLAVCGHQCVPHAFLLAKCAENYVVLHVTDEGIVSRLPKYLIECHFWLALMYVCV